MNKHLWLFVINCFLILGFIGFSVLLILDPDFMSGVTLEEYTNDFCSNINITDPNDPLSLVCDNKFKKEKFVWILLDGLASDQLYLIPDRAEKLSTFFKIKSKEYKQSGSLHESILSGKFSRNYPAKKIKVDHIFKQTKQAGIPVIYKGSSFPVFYLLGRENNDGVLENFELKEPEPFALNSFCPYAVNDLHDGYPNQFKTDIIDGPTGHLLPGYDRKYIYDKFNEHYKENMDKMVTTFDKCLNLALDNKTKSYAYYTMKIDHLNHSFDKHYIGTIINVYGIETTLLGLHRWADEHPEYAIIVSSDHGGQPYNGQDNICNHGCDVDGNEAILLIYTKELGEEKYRLPTKKIWVNDVSPTIAQVLKNVNIPLEAQGIPRELGDDNILRYSALKSKEIQLIQYITKYTIKFPGMKKKMSGYLDKLKTNSFNVKIKTKQDVEINATKEFYNGYMSFLEDMQSKITNEIAGKGKNSFLYNLSYYAIFALLLGKCYYEFTKIQLISNQYNEANNVINHNIILYLIILILLSEVILCFFFSRHIIDEVINISRLLEFGLLALLTFYIMFHYKLKYLLKYIGLFLFIALLCTFMLKFEVFINMKIFFDTEKKWIIFNVFFNYPIAIMYLSYELYAMRKIYCDSKLKVRLLTIIIPYICLIFILIIVFDSQEKVHIVYHTTFSIWLTRLIYFLIIVYGIFSFKNLFKKSSYGTENKEPVQIKKLRSMPNAKIVMFLFIFFICDETERSLLFISFIIVNRIFYVEFTKAKNSYWRLVNAVALLLLPDVVFIANQNSFSFDISLKVAHKVVGWYADETPILTGILFGCHKLKFFMLTGAYLMSLSRVSAKGFMKSETFMLRMVMDIQMTFIIILYFYFLKTGMQEHYLQIFIWIMSKCMVSLLYDIGFAIWFVVYSWVKKCKNNGNILVNEDEKKDDEIQPKQISIELGMSEPHS